MICPVCRNPRASEETKKCEYCRGRGKVSRLQVLWDLITDEERHRCEKSMLNLIKTAEFCASIDQDARAKMVREAIWRWTK